MFRKLSNAVIEYFFELLKTKLLFNARYSASYKFPPIAFLCCWQSTLIVLQKEFWSATPFKPYYQSDYCFFDIQQTPGKAGVCRFIESFFCLSRGAQQICTEVRPGKIAGIDD